MTVRWKPLVILSGLFVGVALAGFITFALYVNSRGTADTLARARAERGRREFDKAKLDYQKVAKAEGHNPAFQEELADFYEDWAREAPVDRKAELRGEYLKALAAAASLGKTRVEPKRRMLAEEMKRDDTVEQVRWAKELAPLDPNNRDVHFVLALDEVDGASPNISEVRRHLKALDVETPRRARTEWIAARVAYLENDKPRLAEILARARAATAVGADPSDRLSSLRLRVMDASMTRSRDALAGQVAAISREAIDASAEPEIPSTRIARIGNLIEELQRYLTNLGLERPEDRKDLETLADELDRASDAIFQKSLAVPGGADLNVYLAYAFHQRFRNHRDRALEIARQGLASPAGSKPQASGSEIAMGLHALAVEATLANLEAKDRFERSSAHIKALLECKFPKYQGFGHMFQGAIDLEKAGMVVDAKASQAGTTPAEITKLRTSALVHLKAAANQLPGIAEAQARYGVALILNQEQAMGRQYLQLAQRLGNLEPQYQIWAAWAVVQAGYPEDAQPMVARMLEEIRAGRLPGAYEGTLHLLNGEIHQARKSPADLKKAIEEYGLAFANGQDATPAVELRLAQIEVMLGRPADALKRIDWLVSKGKAGPSAENLAVLVLQELKRDDEATKRLADGRAKFPESAELAILDATIRAKDGRAEEADRLLVEFLAKVPDNAPAVQMRAQVLAQDLNRPAEARRLLASVADRSDNSAPLVQLALMEMAAKDYPAVSGTIAKVRSRWKDAATGDLLDAQLALARNDLPAASAFFDAALKKDPNNKIVRFWKAQLDGRADPGAASKVFEALASSESTKEVESGLSLTLASKTALAGIALETGELGVAVDRYRAMLKDATNPAQARLIRWQVVAALAAKKEWPAARAEMNVLLADPKAPPTPEDRVRAATFLRMNKEYDAALALADGVLAEDPTHTGAAVTRADVLAGSGKPAEAIATLDRAIRAWAKGGKDAPAVLYLYLAGLEATTPPVVEAPKRALAVLEKGLAIHPASVELVQAKYSLLTITQDARSAAAFLEEKAKADPKGPFRRRLVENYARQADYASAERVASEMAGENPDDAGVAALSIRMLAGRSVEATRRGDRPEARKADDRASVLIRDARSKFKADPTFVQLEAELELRKGDTTRALALCREVDAMAKGSPNGPLLRARIFEVKGQPREAAAAYAEALSRNPRIADARLKLARLELMTGQVDEALRQARLLLDVDPDGPIALAALLVEARASAIQTGSPGQVQANRARAIEKLAAAIKDRPDFADAYLLTADIRMLDGDRAGAVAILDDLLKVRPDDATALTTTIRVLAEPRGKDQPAPKADLDRAVAFAEAHAGGDQSGARMLAVSAGFSRSGQIDLAIAWAEKAAAKLDSPVARLNLGDLLLTQSEQQADASKSRGLQDRALAEFDRVLAANPNVVEAVNNKAWILHSYQGRSKEALELAQGLLQRVDPGALPGEFFDTLGSIQEGLGRLADAEESYKRGLGKSPGHPVLNYHMGSLMAGDPSRARRAADYLKVAQAASDRLPAAMADNLPTLLKKVSQ